MQKDNQGRALLRLPTTMRCALEAAVKVAAAATKWTPSVGLVASQLRSNHGYQKVPAWTVTRKAGR